MKFTKTVEAFDCTAFNAGDLYYLHWRDSALTDVKAIYLCDDVDIEGNQILLKEIVVLEGNPVRLNLRVGNEDLSNVIDIQPVSPKLFHNVDNGRWKVIMETTNETE